MKKTISSTAAFKKSVKTTSGLAQSVERLTAEREVAGSIPDPDQYSGS